LLKKLIGIRAYSAIANIFANLKTKTNYSQLQYPLFFGKNKKLNSVLLIDSFYFMDEFEILQLRLEILSQTVDKFVILEAKHTFTGLEKRAHLSENLHLFEKYQTKMHVVVLDAPYFSRSDLYSVFFDKTTSGELRQVCSRTLTSQNVPLGDSHWVREFFNKEYLLQALQGIPLNSRIVVSDVDEIWNPKKPPTSLPQNGIFVYKQRPFVYLMNNLSDESWRNWTGSVTATLGSFIRYGVNNSRTHHRLPRRVIRTGGWHFSFQGGPLLIKTKLDSYGHQELNTPTNRELISKIQSEFQDIRGIKANFKKNERLLPPEVLAMKFRLPGWFL
jgi:beta-1,4-mannosyl-glycoprotein beta-1,4-N-acetylglucosaminyltransferase